MTDTAGHARYAELDALRAIAALGVVCWHYLAFYHAAPFGHLLAPFYRRGLLMVDFFFVLSGFVLAQAFCRPDRSHDFIGNVRRRLARLYPLHLLTLCVVAGLQWYTVHGLGQPPWMYAKVDAYHFVLNLTLLNWSGLQRGFSFNEPAWSISTEFLINLLFLAILLLHRRLATLLMAAIAALAVTYLIRTHLIALTRPWGVIDHELVRTAAGFFIGTCLQALHARLRPGKPWAWDAMALAAIAVAAIHLASREAGNGGDLLVCFVAFPVLIVGAIRGTWLKRILRWQPLSLLGESSYSIYLLHFPLMLAIHDVGDRFGLSLPFASHVFFIAFFAALVALSVLSYRCIERPAMRWLLGKQPALRDACTESAAT